MTHFRKMHGLGNDFVIFDARKENIFLSPDDMELIADRHWGVGCDLIAVVDKSEKADASVYFFNADGSESGACGNATRCIADIIMTETGMESCALEATYGILNCRKKGDLMVEVDMGSPVDVRNAKLKKDNVSDPVIVNMGNPHCVFFVDDLESIDIETLGPYFENHEMFPDRTNVEFVQVIDRAHLRQRTWERGVGITEACGSGACAVAVAAAYRDLADLKVEVELDGGVLEMEWRESNDHVFMTGPVAYVFDGKLNTV